MIKWYNVTSQLIRLYNHFITLIPNLTLIPNYERFQCRICNGCDKPAGNAYPCWHLVPLPIWTRKCSYRWDYFPSKSPMIFSFFTSNIPWHFLDMTQVQVSICIPKTIIYVYVFGALWIFMAKMRLSKTGDPNSTFHQGLQKIHLDSLLLDIGIYGTVYLFYICDIDYLYSNSFAIVPTLW